MIDQTRSMFYNGTLIESRRGMATEVTPTGASAPRAGGADDELEPPWWRPSRRRERAKEPLTRDAIVEAAIRVLDAEGLDAVTVRRLGQELGTGSATLYWHIANKGELFELVYDRIMGEIELPEPDPARWQDQLREFAREAFRVLRSHRDAVRLSLGRVPVGPSMLRIIEWSLGLLRGAGVPDQIAAYFGDLFGRYLDASVLEEALAALPGDPSASEDSRMMMLRDYFGGLPPERFPNIVALTGELFTGGSDERFELGLDILLRGLEGYVESGQTSGT
jgi:AcrR family transcriptional regulator